MINQDFIKTKPAESTNGNERLKSLEGRKEILRSVGPGSILWSVLSDAAQDLERDEYIKQLETDLAYAEKTIAELTHERNIYRAGLDRFLGRRNWYKRQLRKLRAHIGDLYIKLGQQRHGEE